MFHFCEEWASFCLTSQPTVNTMGRNAKQHQGFAVIISWFTLSKSLWISSWHHWRRSEKEGLSCCPCQVTSALPAENVEQGEKYALWSQGPLIDKTGSHWFWVFAFFLCTSNKEHWNSLPKLQGFHTSKSGLSLCVSDINWIGWLETCNALVPALPGSGDLVQSMLCDKAGWV